MKLYRQTQILLKTLPAIAILLLFAAGSGTARSATLEERISSDSVSCLDSPGPTIILSGEQVERYDTRDNPLAADTKIDARSAIWLAQWPVQDSFDYPVILAGGPNVCFSGGQITGSYPDKIGDPHSTWDRTHSTAAMSIKIDGFFTIENSRIHNYGDAFRIKGDETSPFAIRGAHLTYIRDDCVENDFLRGGLIEDSLFDGCYTGFSTRRSGCSDCDGSQRVMTIRDSLVRLQPMWGVYKNREPIPGHGKFFKLDSGGVSPKLSLHNNIFRADQESSGGDNLIPEDQLESCSGNTMVWLGPEEYPYPLPLTFNGQDCFEITTDKKVWDDAVADWKQRHENSDQSPVSNAGPDQNVIDADGNGEDVTLDGSGSFDPDGSIVSYEWYEGGNPLATAVSPTVNLSLGTHTITLTVTDDDGLTDSDEVVVTVTEPPTGDVNDMYVWDIVFESRNRGKLGAKHDERIAVTIRRDSDADGVAEVTDEPVASVSVMVALSGPVGGTFSGTTNSAGMFSTGWVMDVLNGAYTAEVNYLSHDTFTWDRNLDPTDNDTDSIVNDFPDEQHSNPH